MIEYTKAYVSNGLTFTTLEQAQAEEIRQLLPKGIFTEEAVAQLVEVLVEKGEQIIDILTTNRKSRPRARRINGGRKTRKVSLETLPLICGTKTVEDAAK